MPHMSQPKFMRQYVYALSSDFKAADGTPAKWAPNMPSHWGSESKHLKFDGKATAFELSGDDSLLAVGVENIIHIYDVQTLELKQVLEGHPDNISSLNFAPKSRNGHKLISSSRADVGEALTIWWELDDEGKDTNHLKSIDASSIAKKASDLVLNHFEWSPDLEASQALEVEFKKAVAAAVAKKGLETKTVLNKSGWFSKDGKYMTVTCRDTAISVDDDAQRYHVEVLDAETQTLLHTFHGHTDNITWNRVSPDSKLLASVAWDGYVRVWNLETGVPLHVVGDFGGQMWRGAWSPDSKYLAFSQGSPRTYVYVYDMDTGKQMSNFKAFDQWARSMDWSPDGKLLASGSEDGVLIVWDPISGEEKMRWELSFKNDKYNTMKGFVATVSVRFVGSKLVFQTTEGTVEVYDFDTNLKSQFTRGPEDHVEKMVCNSIRVSHDGKFLISNDADKTMRFWNL